MTNDPVYSEEYYEHLAKILGQAAADWARLPRAERERELTRLHASFSTQNDRAIWPPELGTESSARPSDPTNPPPRPPA